MSREAIGRTFRRACLVCAVAAFGTPACLAEGAAAPPAAVEYRPDVEYGTGGDVKLKLHLAMPTGGTGLRPGLVFLHGGGWAAGSRDDLIGAIKEAAGRGYVAVSVGYRLAPQHHFPAQIEDVKCAVRWMRAHADDLRLDKNRVGAIGFSAGAHLSMLLGTMDPADGLEGDGGWADQSSKVQAVVAYFGPTNLLSHNFPPVTRGIIKHFIGGTPDERHDAYRQASPLTYVNAGDAPQLLLQGTADVLVPFDQAFQMAEALTKAKVPGRVELMLGAGHGWGGQEYVRTNRATYEFFQTWLAEKK
jgi:acetyl esterase/lipase